MHPVHGPGRVRAALPVVIPTDAVAHIDADLGAAACKMMEQNMSAELTTAADCLDPA